MAAHSYHQYCALVRALDVAGDRWTLLIVRELLPGPRRFTDLIEGLPGISRNLLTERLKHLEAEGIVGRKDLPPPAARQVYALTEEGQDLGRAMTGLMAWGARRLRQRQKNESFRARSTAVGMVALADREAAREVTETYQYVIGDTVFHITVDDGSVRIVDGYAHDPAVVMTTDENTWARIVAGDLTRSEARATGTFTVEGDPDAYERQRRIFSRARLLERAEAVLNR